MNKIVIITVIILTFLIVGGGIFLFMHKSRGVGGLNPAIQNENNKVGTTTLDSSKVLVVYFSGSGNTQKLAEAISNIVGGDFRRIEPVKPYPTGPDLYDYTKQERDNDERPKFKDLDINLENYDTIFVGYPIWWYTLPMILYTFFDEYDFAGKTIIPFNTHQGSDDGGTYTTIKNLEKDAIILDGLAVLGNQMAENQQNNVQTWLEKLGFNIKS